MLLALQIIYRLGYKKLKLKDMSYFVCDRNMNFFSNDHKNIDTYMEISNKLIYLFKRKTEIHIFQLVNLTSDRLCLSAKFFKK